MSEPIKDTPALKSERLGPDETAARIEKVGLDGDQESRGSSTDNIRENKQVTYSHLERQRNPYLGKSASQVVVEVSALADQHGMADAKSELARGARLAYDRESLDDLSPTPEERHWINMETSVHWKDKWIQTKMMYYVAFLCGAAAIVQGMDQTAVNGAQL